MVCLAAYVTVEVVDDGCSAGCNAACWDSSLPGSVGASLDDGSFRYMQPGRPSQRFRLFAATLPLGAWPPGREGPPDGTNHLAANRTKWVHWCFVPNRIGEVLLNQAFSKQLLLAPLPTAAQPSRVWLAREMARPSPVSALAVCPHGKWCGVGQEDGSVGHTHRHSHHTVQTTLPFTGGFFRHRLRPRCRSSRP